jgi:GTP:adenosylcobinamide-phosphate guanylyltransferase
MNVIIPMMGTGSRFATEGYRQHKSFVMASGKTIIERVVSPLYDAYGTIHIACSKDNAQILSKLFPSSVVKCIVLQHSDGAADTIRQAVYEMPKNDEPLLCVDSDTILTPTAINIIPESGNAIMTFKDLFRTGMYSYLSVHGDYIDDIVEKEAISYIANAGVYLFESAMVAYYACDLPKIGGREQYLSHAVKNSLRRREWKHADITGLFHCVGTPAQLKQYCDKIAVYGKVFCFDLDKTLLYDVISDPRPIQHTVDYCNHLYDRGGRIVVHTARGMLSRNGNVEAIERELRPIVEERLSEAGIKYHELIMGKPYADVYIDDKAISALEDLEKATGVYYDVDTTCRHHHSIKVVDNRVRKVGDVAAESDYYKAFPARLLRAYFPQVIEATGEELVLEKIATHTYSSLVVTGQLTEHHLTDLLDALYDIHHTESMTNVSDWGYRTKVLERYDGNVELYSQLGIPRDIIFACLQNIYRLHGGIIHGDPVFSNVFEGVKLIDPRGSWDGVHQLYGDIYYDYAKVLQCLYGYDFIMHNMDIEHGYLSKLRRVFYDWFTPKYPMDNATLELRSRVSLLIMSMIPLHRENMDRCRLFTKFLHTTL